MQPGLVTVTLDIERVDARLEVVSLEGAEGMNMLYAFDLLVASESVSLDLDALVGKKAVLGFEHERAHRRVHGIVSALEQDETEHGRALYRATVVPEVWLLSQGRRCRILQSLTTAQVIARVLEESGLRAFRLSLTGTYTPRDVCVQYLEPDWSFLCRLMEEDGIFYFFEQGEHGTTLVIADHASAHEPFGKPAEMRYAPTTGALVEGESVLSFRVASRVRPGKVALLDVSFDTPTKRTEQEAELPHHNAIEVVSYPSATPAQRVLDAVSAGRNLARGTARSVRLCPGSTFKLSGHPRESFDGGYLVTRVEHAMTRDADKGGAYTTSFECIPEGRLCRPEARTPKPRIVGPQAAEVVGPPGVEIHVDEKARVLVKLEWDPSRAGDLTSACWVPVSQASSGAGYGSMIIPRVGSYVLVEFLNGEPDRPIVTGRVFNSLSPSPYPLPQDKTKTVLRTRSTSGHGHNELRFEDQAGNEQVYLRAQRDLDVEALHDAKRRVGNDDALTIEGSRSVAVRSARTAEVGADDALSVGGSRSVTVAGEESIAITGDRGLSVGGDLEDLVAGDRTIEIEGSDELVIGGDFDVTVEGARTASVTGDDTTTVAGNLSQSVEGNFQRIVDGTTFETHSALQVAVSGDTTFKGSGKVLLESDTAQRIGAPTIYISASSKLYIRAKEAIELQVGKAIIRLEDDHVHVTSGTSHETLGGSTHRLNC